MRKQLQVGFEAFNKGQFGKLADWLDYQQKKNSS